MHRLHRPFLHYFNYHSVGKVHSLSKMLNNVLRSVLVFGLASTLLPSSKMKCI